MRRCLRRPRLRNDHLRSAHDLRTEDNLRTGYHKCPNDDLCTEDDVRPKGQRATLPRLFSHDHLRPEDHLRTGYDQRPDDHVLAEDDLWPQVSRAPCPDLFPDDDLLTGYN